MIGCILILKIPISWRQMYEYVSAVIDYAFSIDFRCLQAFKVYYYQIVTLIQFNSDDCMNFHTLTNSLRYLLFSGTTLSSRTMSWTAPSPEFCLGQRWIKLSWWLYWTVLSQCWALSGIALWDSEKSKYFFILKI